MERIVVETWMREVKSPLRAIVLLVAGAITALGYLGNPWWAAWPAIVTLQFTERALDVSERAAGWQIAALCVALIVNGTVVVAVIRPVVAVVRNRRS
jgi:hypothetical protein